ncbi:uncharacterized protein LOC144166812 [Haemaphysalis longicornis]
MVKAVKVQFIASLSSEIKQLADKCDDAENRLRRSNLLFFGIKDENAETWAESEAKIISFCATHLEMNITDAGIERAHRLGRYCADKMRPIIVKFAHYKEKSRVLQSSRKLKETPFFVREDYSARVRLARQKLYSFGQQSNASFKIRFDKLSIDKKQYTYDAMTDSVVELTT